MRLFVAAHIPREVQDKVGDFLDSFHKFPGQVKWVQPHNIHITLKFLGETEPGLVEQIKSTLRAVTAGAGQIEITLEDCGAFPNLRAPRVFWIGINDPANRLKSLAEKIDREVSLLGFEKEKRAFSPHLTLGRVKDARQLELLRAAFGRASFPPVPVTISAIYLVQSFLKPSGPVYKDIDEYVL